MSIVANGSLRSRLASTAVHSRSSFFHRTAVLLLVLVFIGFARTFFLRMFFTTAPPPNLSGTTDLTPRLYVHGLVMTAWFGLLVVQTALVASDRTRLHRRLGMAGSVVAVLVVVVNVWALLNAVSQQARAGEAFPVLRATLFGNLATLVMFAGCVLRALAYRHVPAVHKRLMWFASIVMVTPAISRIGRIFGLPLGVLGIYGVL